MGRSNSRSIYLVFALILVLAALPVLAFSAWFFYDGMIGYPEKQRRQLAYERLAQQVPPQELDARWIQEARSNGWPTDTPDAPMSDTSIHVQYILGVFCALIGVGVLLIPAVILLTIGLRLRSNREPPPAKT